MYCSHLWYDFKNETLRRLIVGYNHSFHIIMKYPRRVACLFLIMFLAELWRKSIYGFKQRVDNSLKKHSCQHFTFKFPVEKTLANSTLSFTSCIAPMHMLVSMYTCFVMGHMGLK